MSKTKPFDQLSEDAVNEMEEALRADFVVGSDDGGRDDRRCGSSANLEEPTTADTTDVEFSLDDFERQISETAGELRTEGAEAKPATGVRRARWPISSPSTRRPGNRLRAPNGVRAATARRPSAQPCPRLAGSRRNTSGPPACRRRAAPEGAPHAAANSGRSAGARTSGRAAARARSTERRAKPARRPAPTTSPRPMTRNAAPR